LALVLEEMKREESPIAYAILSKGFVTQTEQMRREIDEQFSRLERTEAKLDYEE